MSDDLTFYGKDGRPVCYISAGENLYLWNGRPGGYITSGKVYAFSGKFLSWFDNGWLYDQKNHPALFSDDASGGPSKSAKKAHPAKAAWHPHPAKSAKQTPPARPARSMSWSIVASEAYFGQA